MFTDVSHDCIKFRRSQEDRSYYEEMLILRDGERWLDYLSDKRGRYHYGPCVIQIMSYPGGGVWVVETPGRVVPIPQADGEYKFRLEEGQLLVDPREDPLSAIPWSGTRWEVLMRVKDGELIGLSLTDTEAEG